MDPTSVTERLANLSPAKRALLEQRLRGRPLDALAGRSIPIRASREFAPLSFAQQRLWFLNQLEPESPVYNEPRAVRLMGLLNREALESTFNQIIARHEILRTTIALVDGEPMQRIAARRAISLPVVDLKGWSAEDRDTEARRLIQETVRRPFNLSQDLMLRVLLLRMGDREHILVVVKHHVASDGWSSAIFWQEVSALYRAFVSDRPADLGELSVQYADYAVWQRERFRGEVLETQLSYWREQLENLATLQLPTSVPRPAIQSYRGAKQTFVLSNDLSDKLKTLSRREGVTLFMTLLAAFQTLLHRYTGQEEIAVGSLIAGRNRAEIEGLIGFFVNTLVLRTDVSGNLTFRELLQRVRGVCLGAYAHQDLPFEKLVEELQPQRTLNRNPLFQVTFQLSHSPRRVLTLPGIEAEEIEADSVTAKFDLSLSMADNGERIAGRIQFNTDLFDDATMERMSGHFQTLLKAIVADPQRAIFDLPMLSERERHQLLIEWNDTQRDYPKEKCIHQLFEQQVENGPDAIAVVFEREQLTYKELNQRANQLAHNLIKRGVQAETVVGICVERSLEMIIGLLAILKAGSAYVPLDAQYPEDRLSFMIEDSQAALILTQRKFAQRLRRYRDRSIYLDDEWTKLAQESSAAPITDATPQTLAYVIYTSGTTGTPKGVMIEHKSVVNYLSWFNQCGLADQAQRMPLNTNLTFDACLKQLFAPLLRGDQVWIVPEECRSDPVALLKSLAASGATALNCVPSFWRALLDAVESNPTLISIKRLSLLLLGGEPSSDTLIDRTLSVFPHLEIWNLYGPTEATANVIAGPMTGHGTIALGRPVRNAEIYLLDNHFQTVPIGVAGELYIGGVGLARGYLNRAEQTSESFIPNPFSREAGARMYKTGDLCRYLADGNIEFLGRVDQQVKIRGFRIELGEIESVLEEHPAVRDAVVVARVEDDAGEPRDSAGSAKRLVAYVVASQSPAPKIEELRRYLKEKLPDYMVPSTFEFLATLPLTVNGKVDRKALPAFDFSRLEQPQQRVAARDELELQLTKLWERVLKVRPIGVRDNFFDLGGHSLLAVRLFAQIAKIVGKELPLATLFHAPTIEQLAGLIRRQQWSAPWKSLVSIQPGGSRAPFFCVHAHDGGVLFWRDLARHLGSDQPFYALQPQGLDGKEHLHGRVEEMAAHYIRDIRTLQPEGPYFIGGHCIGGLIAFEMAQQLHLQGERVGLLALFDSYAPRGESSARRSLAFRYRRQLIRLFQTASLHVGNVSVLEPKERFLYIKGKFNKALYKLYMAVGRAWVPAARNRRNILNAATQAARSYHSKVYPGKITLFRATHLGGGIKRDPQMGWGPLAAGGLESHLIPGYHAHIVLEPRVRVLAQELTAALCKAQEIEDSEPIMRAPTQQRLV